jgi:hypothetical protein
MLFHFDLEKFRDNAGVSLRVIFLTVVCFASILQSLD